MQGPGGSQPGRALGGLWTSALPLTSESCPPSSGQKFPPALNGKAGGTGQAALLLGRTPYHRPLLSQLKSFSCYCSTSWWAQELLRGRVAGVDLSEGQWGREPTDSHQGVWERVPPSACPCTRQWEGRSSGSGGHPLSFPSFLCPSPRVGRGPKL